MLASLDIFSRLLLAIAIGALIGLERERFAKEDHELMFGGIRTFTLIALLGALSIYVSQLFFSWFVVPVFVGLVTLMALTYRASVVCGLKGSISVTGEVVAILTFIFGMLTFSPNPVYAAVLGVITTTFLFSKHKLHDLVNHISPEEMYSALVFGIVAFVVLPFLPNEPLGPFGVFNPYKIWLFVVFISGMGFVGYILIKVFGSKNGIGLTGFFGGIVSSTAVTLSFAGISKKFNDLKMTELFVFAVIVANAVMFVRVLIEVYVIDKLLLPYLLLPMVVMILVSLIFAGVIWLTRDSSTVEKEAREVTYTSPLHFRPALKFGFIFAVMLFLVKIAQLYMGDTGLYITSALSGLVDADAITLSMASVAGEEVSRSVAATAIFFGAMSNTVVKFGLAAAFGSKKFRNILGVIFGFVILAGLLTMLFI
jgi:uncharacterized membrane protein (DUF4010 family)